MADDSIFRPTVAPLTDMLRQVALDIAGAQAALDAFAEAQAASAAEAGAVLPSMAFYFPEVELDLRLGFTLTRFAGRQQLSVTPANPTASGFFSSISFSSRLRARIAPRAALLIEEPHHE